MQFIITDLCQIEHSCMLSPWVHLQLANWSHIFTGFICQVCFCCNHTGVINWLCVPESCKISDALVYNVILLIKSLQKSDYSKKIDLLVVSYVNLTLQLLMILRLEVTKHLELQYWYMQLGALWNDTLPWIAHAPYGKCWYDYNEDNCIAYVNCITTAS